MLIEAAIGDAFGLAFESWATPELIAENYKLDYQSIADPKNKHYGAIQKGCYTDDTQMMIALAEALVENDPWTKQSLADRYVKVFRRDKRKGYSGGFYRLLSQSNNGSQLLKQLNGDSDKSGAAMRAAVLGFIPNINDLVGKSSIQAAITHDSPGGITSANMVSLMAHYFRYGIAPKSDLDDWLWDTRLFKAGELDRWSDGRVSSNGMNCARAAKTAIIDNNTLSGVLKESVSWGGDTDTIACIALAVASQSEDIENDLPQRLYDGLENGVFGRSYLVNLDEKLEIKFPRGERNGS